MAGCRLRRPPWWVKVPLYLATWPRSEGRDFRVELHRRYLRTQKERGLPAANRMARREALSYSGAAAERSVWWVMRLLRLIGAAG